MSVIERIDAPIGEMIGPYLMSIKIPELGNISWYTSYRMGPYNDNSLKNAEQIDRFAPFLKLRWIKDKKNSKAGGDPAIFFRLTVIIEYGSRFFIPLFYDKNTSSVVRPDIKVSYLGKIVMINIGLITYKDANLKKPLPPTTNPPMKLTKYTKLNFDFDESMTEQLKAASIYVNCVFGDPETSTISKVILEDVDEL